MVEYLFIHLLPFCISTYVNNLIITFTHFSIILSSLFKRILCIWQLSPFLFISTVLLPSVPSINISHFNKHTYGEPGNKSSNTRSTQVSIKRWMGEILSIYTHSGILCSHKKEENISIPQDIPCVCSWNIYSWTDICTEWCNMDEPWEAYAKWNKSTTKGQILYVFTYMRYPEKSNSYRQKAKWLLPGDGGRKKGELPFNRYRDSVLQDKKKSSVDGWWCCWHNVCVLNAIDRYT